MWSYSDGVPVALFVRHDGQFDDDPGPLADLAVDARFAAEESRPLANSRQSEAAFADVVRLESDAPIFDGDAEAAAALRQLDAEPSCSGCAPRVHQGLLGDAVDGILDDRRQALRTRPRCDTR